MGWRSVRKGITCEEREYRRRARQEPLFGIDHKSILLPVIERGEPQIPVEARLIGSEYPRLRSRILRLITKRIWPPRPAVIRAFELNLIAASGHNRKKTVPVRDSIRFQFRYR